MVAGGAADGSRHAIHSAIPIGEQIDVLNLVGDRARNFATLETNRDQENAVQRQTSGAIERVSQFALKLSPFGDGARRETGDETIRVFDGALDGSRPVLSGKQFVLVEPGRASHGAQGLAQAPRARQILVDVSDEDLG